MQRPIIDVGVDGEELGGNVVRRGRHHCSCAVRTRQRPQVLVGAIFQDTNHAAAFLDALRTRIWAISDRSPALDGTPRTLSLQLADPRDTTLKAFAYDAG